MSFTVFKQNMLAYMSNQPAINSYEDWGRFFTTQYDLLIRRGFQVINQVPIKTGNKELMEQMVNLAALGALQVREGQHDIINNIGKGIVGYWTGATLMEFPAPVIPAVGSVSNIATTSALVTNPGKFPEMGVQFPTNNIGSFLDQLITAIRIHLLSVEGIYQTVSIYPSVPTMTIAPGFLQWTGFEIPSES